MAKLDFCPHTVTLLSVPGCVRSPPSPPCPVCTAPCRDHLVRYLCSTKILVLDCFRTISNKFLHIIFSQLKLTEHMTLPGRASDIGRPADASEPQVVVVEAKVGKAGKYSWKYRVFHQFADLGLLDLDLTCYTILSGCSAHSSKMPSA